MTKVEFKAWTDDRKVSHSTWKVDTIRWRSERELLFSLGERNGKFIWIYPDGMLHAGTYEDAVPDLMEATFQPIFIKKFVTREEAYNRLVECGGVQFLCKQLVDDAA